MRLLEQIIPGEGGSKLSGGQRQRFFTALQLTKMLAAELKHAALTDELNFQAIGSMRWDGSWVILYRTGFGQSVSSQCQVYCGSAQESACHSVSNLWWEKQH